MSKSVGAQSKICSRCGLRKPVEQFGLSRGRPASRCKQCNREAAQLWQQENPSAKNEVQVARQRVITRLRKEHRLLYDRLMAEELAAVRGQRPADLNKPVHGVRDDGHTTLCGRSARYLTEHTSEITCKRCLATRGVRAS